MYPVLWGLSRQEQPLGCPGPAPKVGKVLSGAGLGSKPETQPSVQGKCLLCVCSAPGMPLFSCNWHSWRGEFLFGEHLGTDGALSLQALINHLASSKKLLQSHAQTPRITGPGGKSPLMGSATEFVCPGELPARAGLRQRNTARQE